MQWQILELAMFEFGSGISGVAEIQLGTKLGKQEIQKINWNIKGINRGVGIAVEGTHT